MSKIKQTKEASQERIAINEQRKQDVAMKLKEIKELEAYAKNPDVGVDPEHLIAFANNHKFKINPEGHLKKNRDLIRAIQDKYFTQMEQVNDELTRSDIYEKATREILDIALLEFSYNKSANHIDLGPVTLGHLANEVSTFLVIQGGKPGYQHWQMQVKSATLNRMNT